MSQFGLGELIFLKKACSPAVLVSAPEFSPFTLSVLPHPTRGRVLRAAARRCVLLFTHFTFICPYVFLNPVKQFETDTP